MEKWSQTKFHVEHFWAMVAEAQISLYRGEPRAVLQMLNDRWSALDGSLLLRCQLSHTEARHLRARAALASAAGAADAKELLAIAERDARWIESEKMDWSNPPAALLRAGIAATRGDLKGARQRLKDAIAGFEAAGMALYADAARYRSGRIEGGEGGGAVAAGAVESLEGRSVAAPRRMVEMLAPGFAD
jgi:ATP/maltotriose-dependent transcriptional regulator MalT